MSSIWTIRRSATDSTFAGLCAGVARQWGIDPVLVRVGCALLALSGGIGIVLYLAGWLLIPVEGKDRAPIDDLVGEQARKWPKGVWIVLVIAACIVAMAIFGAITPFGFGPAVILAAIWYFGYYRNRAPRQDAADSQTTPAPGSLDQTAAVQHQFFSYPGPPTPFTEAARAWQQRVEEHQRQAAAPTSRQPPQFPPYQPQATERAAFLATPDPVGLYSTNTSAQAERPQPPLSRGKTRSARRLRLVSLVVLVLTLSGLGIADSLGGAIPLAVYFGAALLVVGLTLVAATWLGRASGLLFAGFVLAIAVLASTIGGPVAEQRGWGPLPLVYSTAAELPTTPDNQEIGRLYVDLSELEISQNTSYAAHVDVGKLDVKVPADTNVRIHYRLDAGVLLEYGVEPRPGSDLQGTIEPVSPDPSKPILTLTLSVDAGQLQVRQ